MLCKLVILCSSVLYCTFVNFQADAKKSGIIGALDAATFLKKSGISEKVLGQVHVCYWGLKTSLSSGITIMISVNLSFNFYTNALAWALLEHFLIIKRPVRDAFLFSCKFD